MQKSALAVILALSGACASTAPPAGDSVARAERESRDLLMRIVIALGHDTESPHVVRWIGDSLPTTGWILTERDPWGRRYWLDGDARRELIVASCGPDRQAGTPDDIIASLPRPLPERWGTAAAQGRSG